MSHEVLAAESAAQPETRGIDLIGDSQRHGRARDLLAVWAAPNVSLLNFTIGATMIGLGLELWQGFLVIVLASLTWIAPGIIAISGPAAGTSGSVISRAIYGILGNRMVVALVGWLVAAVYLALNWIGSSFLGAGALTQMGIADPLWAALIVTIVVSAITVLVAVYGHGLILRTYGFLSVALVIIFLMVAVFALPQADIGYVSPAPLGGVALVSAMTIAFTILAAAPLSYINSPDISRYLPRAAKPSHIALATSIGGALPGIVFTTIGMLVATAYTPESLASGVETALLGLLPTWFGPILVIGVIVNTIAVNGMTTYTSSMALQAIGLPLKRIPAAVIVGVIGTILTIVLVLSTTLLGAVSLILQFLVIISAPTMAVFVVDVLLRRGRYNGDDLFDERPGGAFWYTRGWGIPGIAAIVIGGIMSALCLTTTVWAGPISIALGYVDLSTPMGLIVAAVVYLALRRVPALVPTPAR